MPKGTVVRAADVKTLYVDPTYSSKMLIDHTNSLSQDVQINMGIVAPGAKHPDHNHEEGYDEVYIILKGDAMVRLDGIEHILTSGDVVYIPGGSYHSITNLSDTETVTIITVWPKHPAQGINPVYDLRLKEWGKSFVTIHDEAN
jgi:quercetin dioxygenase-like cupin family protein